MNDKETKETKEKDSFRIDRGFEAFYVDKIDELKNLYGLDNKGFMKRLIDEHIDINKSLNENIEKACKIMKKSRGELLLTPIERYINKTLKGDGTIKDKHKKSVKAEDELLQALKKMVDVFQSQPENRKFISPWVVQKFLLINNGKDYKQKHLNVIKRVLRSPEADFVNQYHIENNLTSKSNTNKKEKGGI